MLEETIILGDELNKQYITIHRNGYVNFRSKGI
jgi:hypothetical protein